MITAQQMALAVVTTASVAGQALRARKTMAAQDTTLPLEGDLVELYTATHCSPWSARTQALSSPSPVVPTGSQALTMANVDAQSELSFVWAPPGVISARNLRDLGRVKVQTRMLESTGLGCSAVAALKPQCLRVSPQ